MRQTWNYILYTGIILILTIIVSKCSTNKSLPALDVGYEDSGSGSQKIIIKKNSGDVKVTILKVLDIDTVITDTIEL